MLAMLGLITVAGCDVTQSDRVAVNRAIVHSLGDMAIDNAIIAQHTLYPYHFIRDGSALNELGEKELAVLATHYRDQSGELNVHRGPAGEELYRARVARVVENLLKAGVGGDNVRIQDGFPGGEGMPSEKVIQITAKRNSPTSPLYYGGSAGGGMGGAGEVLSPFGSAGGQ